MARAPQQQKGFGLVEVIIAASIISLVITALVGTTSFFLRTSTRNTSHLQANYLLEEGVESLKLIRDSGWDTFITPLTFDRPYYFYWTGSTWVSTTSTTTINGTFNRTFALSPVFRDVDDDIGSGNSSNFDSGTRKATVTVSWYDTTTRATTSKSIVTYITDLFEN